MKYENIVHTHPGMLQYSIDFNELMLAYTKIARRNNETVIIFNYEQFVFSLSIAGSSTEK